MSSNNDDHNGFDLRPRPMSNAQVEREQWAGIFVFEFISFVSFWLFGWILRYLIIGVVFIVGIIARAFSKPRSWWNDGPAVFTEDTLLTGLVFGILGTLVGVRLGNTLAVNLWTTVLPVALAFTCGTELGRNWRFYLFLPSKQAKRPGGKGARATPRNI